MASPDPPARTTQITRDGLTFDVHEAGPADGEPVVLLHGFPQYSDSWNGLVPLLTAAGYRTVAMDQRGYSPGARPLGRRAYRISELVADALALVEHAGGRAHVVGHDWGGMVAWSLAMHHPDRVRTLTALSTPHPQAILRAFVTSAQALMLWYWVPFQAPWLPERLLTASRFEQALVQGGQSREAARRDAARLHGDALTGPINWYRAAPLSDPRATRVTVRVPTLYVWSDGDVALTRAAAELTERHVEGSYTFEVLPGVSHWIPDEAPAEVAAMLLPHLKQ